MSQEVLLHRLLQVASGRGAHPAVVSRETQVTYAALYAQAAYVDQALRRAGVGRGQVVALALEKSASYLGALLGTWLSGAAFVPLSPQLPEQRRQAILEETGCRALIHAAGESPPPGRLAIALDGGERAELPAQLTVAPDDLAYVLYTSGSTGRPKGIRVAHRGLLPLFEHQVKAFGLTPSSRSLFYLSTNFDAAISDLGTALLAGATLVIEAPERLVPGSTLGPTLAEQGVTHWDLPPALLPHLSTKELPSSLQTLIIGGEPADPAAVRALAERFLVVNVYGPTEATICTSLCNCGPDWSQPLLGDVVPGVRYQVMDEAGRASLDGELWISGPCLALGYQDQPELEALRFIDHAGERWYRTSDLVSTRPDGRLVFVGRKDRQLKVDGVLVAPEEIEAALLLHPGVGGAAAGRDVDGELVAWVEPQRDVALAEDALRAHLATILPRGLRPRRVMVVDRLPRGFSGKIDHQALRGRAPTTPPPTPTPHGPVDLWMNVWSQVLGARPGVDDDLQELGADSLRALRAATLLGAEGIVVPPALLVSHRTIGAQLAAFVGLSGPPDEGRSAQSLAQDVEAEAPFSPRGSAGSAAPMARVLITGATGFLGPQVLTQLLQHQGLNVSVLVRARSEEEAAARITQAAARQGLLLLRRPDHFLLGDVAEVRLGLDADRWSSLSREVDTIIHVAGAVSLTAPYERLRPTNVGGAREMLRLLSEGCPKRLHYTSTLSVFVGSDLSPGFIAADTPLSACSTLYGGYAQSKWAAEHLLRSSGLAEWITFYRLGLLVGAPSSGQIPARDLLALTIRGLAELGSVPAGLELRFDMTPVDHAARVLSAIALAPGPAPQTLNVCSEAGATFSELLAAFDRAGRPLKVLPAEVWREQARRHLGFGGSLEAGTAAWILARAADQNRLRAFDLFQATGFRFDTGPTERSTGLVCPRLGPEELFYCVRACLASGGPSPQTAASPWGG